MTAQVIPFKNLDDAVRAIHAKFAEALSSDKRAYSARISAGQMLLDLRRRIESGEAGDGVEWWPWYLTKFVRSRKDAEKVMRLAAEDDPELAWEEEKAKTREQVAKHRAGKKSPAYVSAKGADDNENEDDENDPVDQAFRLVKSMNREQQQRFIVKLKEHFRW